MLLRGIWMNTHKELLLTFIDRKIKIWFKTLGYWIDQRNKNGIISKIIDELTVQKIIQKIEEKIDLILQ